MLKLSKLKILINSIFAILYKYYLLYKLKNNKLYLDTTHNNTESLIVSLTSYGRRVRKTVFFTILSLLNQDYKPKKIILWLDSTNWNETNIPQKIKKLEQNGIEINYCSDIKSYKKLCPTIEKYPQEIILTVDDDMIYKKSFIKEFWTGHLKYPDRIICSVAREIKFDSHGQFLPYNLWPVNNNNNNTIFPIGVGGILYPPNSLACIVNNSNLFMKLAPRADDIWFWKMAQLNNTSYYIIKLKNQILPLDAIYDFFHAGSSLNSINRKENENDMQLSNVINYFKLNE